MENLKFGTVLTHKKHGYTVVFKCMVGSKGYFRTNNDFQFKLSDFKL